MGQARIVYVEDNPENRLLVRRLLAVLGYELIEAENAEQLYQVLASIDKPDLILVDLHLPGTDGFTIIRELRQREELKDVPIVALTADVLRDTPAKCYQAGCDGYITKPIDIDTFPEMLSHFLRKMEKAS